MKGNMTRATARNMDDGVRVLRHVLINGVRHEHDAKLQPSRFFNSRRNFTICAPICENQHGLRAVQLKQLVRQSRTARIQDDRCSPRTPDHHGKVAGDKCRGADTEDGDALGAIEQPYGGLDVGTSSRRSHRCDRILMSTQDLVDGTLSLGINFSEGARHIVCRRSTLAQGRRDCCLKLAKPFEAQRLNRSDNGGVRRTNGCADLDR